MGVLLRLGDVELPPARLRDRAGETRHDLRREGDLDRKARLVLGHRDDEEAGGRRPTRGRRPVEARRTSRRRARVELTGAVGPEVRVDEHLAVEDDAVGPVDRPSAARTRRSRRGRTRPRSPRVADARGVRRRGRSRRSPSGSGPSACHDPSRSSGPRRWRSGHRDGRRRARSSRSATKPSADAGGVSRPSSSAWTRTRGRLRAARQLGQGDEVTVVRVDATGADQADDVQRPVRRSPARTASASRSAGRSKNDPSAMAASIRGRSWSTGRPAPMLRCPTSELPICPGRQPDRLARGLEPGMRPALEEAAPAGMRAAAIASARGSEPIPNPSMTTRTIGAGAAGAGHVPLRVPPPSRPGAGHDRGHLVGLERGAADERAIDRRLGHELVDVRRRDAPAVEDRRSLAAIVEAEVRKGRRIAPAISAASAPPALRPVPIAQTGS